MDDRETLKPGEPLPEHLIIRNMAEQLLRLNDVCPDCLWEVQSCVCMRTDA